MSLGSKISNFLGKIFRLQEQVKTNSSELKELRKDFNALAREVKRQRDRWKDREVMLDQQFQILSGKITGNIKKIESEIKYEKDRIKDKETILFQRLENIIKEIESRGKDVDNKLLEFRIQYMNTMQELKENSLLDGRFEQRLLPESNVSSSTDSSVNRPNSVRPPQKP